MHIIESTDGAATWTQKFATSAAVRSALPALSIAADGTIGLLYAGYDPATNQLSQHLLTTSNDFADTQDSLLGTESNTIPATVFSPYLGDFYDMTSIGDTFYGIFSASNADNGIDALFPDVSFQRNFTGSPGAADFELENTSGGSVNFSIDPYFFSLSFAVPEPATLALFGTALLGLVGLTGWHRRRS